MKALPARRAAGDRRGEGTTLNSIGATYISLGDLQKAVDYFKQSLPVRREVGDNRGEAVTVNNIGVIYHDLGQIERSTEYFLRSLQLRRQLGDKESEATTLQNLAKNYLDVGDRKSAAEYLKQTLDILDTFEQRRNVYATIELKGDYYDLIGEKQKALDCYSQSLALAQAGPDIFTEHWIERKMGSIVYATGDLDGAFKHYSRALDLVRSMESKTGESNMLALIAHVQRDRGYFEEALKAAQAAIDRAESIRSGIETDDLRASYFATAQRLYSFTIDLLMQMHKRDPLKNYATAALKLSEHARARILLESLIEAKANIREGADQSLLASQRATEQQLNDQAVKFRRLLGGKHSDEQINDIRKQIETLRSKYEEIQAQIRKSSPRYAALVQPQGLDVSAIQAEVLDNDAVLLEYSLGEQVSYLWVVTSHEIASYELPKRDEIEGAARHVYELLAARNKPVRFEQPEAKHLRVERADAEFPVAASALSKMILGPAISHLGMKRLLIVADGALQYIPFAALPSPADSERATGGSNIGPQPLVFAHEVVSLPSASTLAALRSEVMGRAPAPKTLAVLADPVFASDDVRLTTAHKLGGNKASVEVAATRGVKPESDVTRAIVETNGDGDSLQWIPRLPFTRREADAISAFVPASSRTEALDFAASRSTAISGELGQYRFLHFATHGFLDSRHPELSGIVLSLFDKDGHEQDGFLRAHEIYELKLPADLVVLSGCRTGLGKEIRGEGLIGLTRGFMYAGAARVMVSLWDVNDQATAELMSRFYKLMLANERLSPSAALKTAQNSMAKDKRWSAPYYWAAFVLQGEPK